MPAFSVLDLAFISEGATSAVALKNRLDLAQDVERCGYRRFWLANRNSSVTQATFLASGGDYTLQNVLEGNRQ
jgi:hypothetical protein